MRSSDVFALPSEMEAFGLVFLEAAAEGLPTVAYRSKGVPEIFPHGQRVALHPGDTHALAANIYNS
jgi:glycosyltransferase involved in cell wall biosynthesis